MGRSCCVPNCSSSEARRYKSNKEKVSLFKLFGDRLIKWNVKTPRKARKSTCYFVCEKHFQSNYIVRELRTDVYTIPLKYPHLTEDAVPTIFPECPQYPSKKVTKHLTEDTVPTIFPECRQYPSKKVTKRPMEEKYDSSLLKIRKVVLIPPSASPLHKENSSNSSICHDVGSPKSLFNNIVTDTSLVLLPSPSWGLHVVAGAVVIFEMVGINDIIIRKKLIIREENNMSCYIFEHLCENDTVLNNVNVVSVEALQCFLEMFDSLSVCHGGIDLGKCPSDFSSTSYEKDKNCGRLRHVKCPYIVSNEDCGGNAKVKCKFCKKSSNTVRSFTNRRSKTELPREIRQRRLCRNLRQRTKRLGEKNESLLVELKELKEKMKSDESNILNETENLDGMHCQQKLQIEFKEIKQENY